MTMIIDGTNGLTFPDTSKQYNSYYSFKNRIINGAMVIDQRNAGASVTPTNSQYLVDRWMATLTQASKFTVQRNAGSVTPPAGFTNYLGVTSTSAYSITSTDAFRISQQIEGFNIADLAWGTANAQAITVSFWVRSSLTGTFGAQIVNGGATRAYPFTYTISAANTWEQKSVTISGDTSGTWNTDNTSGMFLGFGLGYGTSLSGTANAWNAGTAFMPTGATSVVGTNGATFYITGVQLEKGSTATSFDYRPYGTELALCQRYYYRIKADAANRLLSEYGQCFSTTGFVVTAQFPVAMRTRPTALEQDGTAGDYKVFAADTTNRSCNSVPTYNSNTSENFALIEGTVASGLVAGNATVMSSVNSSAYLGWSAEL
jgi:hypothetical protein